MPVQMEYDLPHERTGNKMKLKTISTVLYLVISVIALAMSMVFLGAGEFFPYHAEASGLKWSEITPGLQLVLMSLIRLAGLGWLVFALGLGFLTTYCYHIRDGRVVRFVIPGLILIYFGGVFGITFYVYLQTRAATPWTSTVGVIILDILAFACSMLSGRLRKGQESV